MDFRGWQLVRIEDTAWTTAFAMLLIAVPFILTHTGGLWLSIGGRILCAGLAYWWVDELGDIPNSNRDSARLLNEAARFENVDAAKAIGAYEEIIRLYPNTPASEEATRNIQSLMRQM